MRKTAFVLVLTLLTLFVGRYSMGRDGNTVVLFYPEFSVDDSIALCYLLFDVFLHCSEHL